MLSDIERGYFLDEWVSNTSSDHVRLVFPNYSQVRLIVHNIFPASVEGKTPVLVYVTLSLSRISWTGTTKDLVVEGVHHRQRAIDGSSSLTDTEL